MPLTHAVPAHLLLNRWTLLCDRIDWLYAPSPRQTAPQANKCLLSFRVAHYCLLCTVRRGALTYTDNSNFIQKNDTRKLLVTTNTTILLQHPRRTKKNMYTHAHTRAKNKNIFLCLEVSHFSSPVELQRVTYTTVTLTYKYA